MGAALTLRLNLGTIAALVSLIGALMSAGVWLGQVAEQVTDHEQRLIFLEHRLDRLDPGGGQRNHHHWGQ